MGRKFLNMKMLVSICRVLVGSLFIVSGLIKANDAVGFAYKLEEYFSPDVLSWLTWMEPYAYPLAVFICIAEIVVGLAVLLGAKMRLASWSLLLMIVFFTFLTFYSAFFNKVTDCGCFGDALKLTPWGSFYKDLILLVLIIPIFLWRGKIKLNNGTEDIAYGAASLVIIAIFCLMVLNNTWAFPIWFTMALLAVSLLVKSLVKGNAEWLMAGAATVLCAGFSYYTHAHLPIKDFRPYAVGKSITEGMKTAEELGLQAPEYANVYIMKRLSTGEEFEMYSTEYMEQRAWEDTTLKLVEALDEQVKLSDGYEPPVHDFVFYDENGNDVTEKVLAGKRLLVVAYDLSKSELSIQPALAELANGVQRGGGVVVGLTSTGWEDIEAFRHEHAHAFPYMQGDGTTLKTIVRSTPGLVALDNGTIIGKWHYNDMPSAEELMQLLR